MREAGVVLLPLTQADGKVKARPAVVLRQLPGFGDWLVCGISTQLHQFVGGFDEQVSLNDSDFSLSGLTAPSVIRLSFLQSVRLSAIMGRIGAISAERHHRLLANLSRHLAP
jgi:mRNA interferase MazF